MPSAMNVVVFQFHGANGRHHPFGRAVPGHNAAGPWRPSLLEVSSRKTAQSAQVAHYGSRTAAMLGGVGCLRPFWRGLEAARLSQKKVAKRRALRRASRSEDLPATQQLVHHGDVGLNHRARNGGRHGPEQRQFRAPWQPPYLSALIVPRGFRTLSARRVIGFTTKRIAHIKLLRRAAHACERSRDCPHCAHRLNNSFTRIFRKRSCHPWLASFNPTAIIP